MGVEKNRQIEAEDNWRQYSSAKCAACGATVPLEEKDSYFETGMCGHCRHHTEKDD